MDSRHGKARLNVEGDRLSNLPDDLIHKILSFVGIKLAVQTSALSSRWRFLWTSLPCLNFISYDFNRKANFAKCVTNVLSRRNNQIEVTSAKLSFHGKVNQAFVRRVLDYAISHNVQQLTVSCTGDYYGIPFPLHLFSSQSLKHLTIAGYSSWNSVGVISTWEIATLTTLHLEFVTFNDEVTDKCTGIFSKCANLKKLVLKHCSMDKSNGVDICHPRLSNLTLEFGSLFKNILNVVTPQLKNLTIRCWQDVHLSCAPELVSLIFEGSESDWVQFSLNGLPSLETVDLCISKQNDSDKLDKTYARIFFDQLQQLHNAKHLTVNLQIFQLLPPLMELIPYQPSPFVELKSLKAYPRGAYSKVQEIPNEVKKYFLDSSPSATFTMVSCEEMRALENATSAQQLMTKLWAMLEHEKVKLETYRAHMDRGNSAIKSYEPDMHEQGNVRADNMQIDKWEKINEVNSYWTDLGDHIEHGKKKTSDIISKLLDIKPLLIELPASKRAHIEASFSSLCAEVKTVMNEILDCMKIQSHKEQSSLRSTFLNLL